MMGTGHECVSGSLFLKFIWLVKLSRLLVLFGICAFLVKCNSFDWSSEADMAEGVALHARGRWTDAQTCQDWNAKVGNQDRNSSEYEISIGIVGL